MATAKRASSKARNLYDRDFFAWTQQQQAELLRRGRRDTRLQISTSKNLAEEIASLGKRDRRALASHLARIIEHPLKLQYSRAEEPRPGW